MATRWTVNNSRGLFLIIGLLLLASCFQSTNNKNDLIVGKWKCTLNESVFYYESSPDEPQVIPQDENDSTTFEFTKEGVLRISNGEDVLQANYSLNGDTIVVEGSKGQDIIEIKELTKTRLVLLMITTGEEGNETFRWEDTYEFEKT